MNIHIGISAVKALRNYFPDFWAAHVAPRRVTPTSLRGAAWAFLGLLNEKVDLSEWMYGYNWSLGCRDLITILDDPPVITDDGESVWDVIEQTMVNPPLVVYGVDLHAQEQEDFDPLPVLLSNVFGMPVVHPSLFSAVMEDGDLMCDLLRELPRIWVARSDGFEVLAKALEGVQFLGVEVGPAILYAVQQTGNFFADTGPFEATDMMTYGAWDWHYALDARTLDLDEIAKQQQQAREFAQAYSLLALRVMQRPAEDIPALVEVIAEAAKRINIPVTEPGSEDDNYDNEYTDEAEAEALASA